MLLTADSVPSEVCSFDFLPISHLPKNASFLCHLQQCILTLQSSWVWQVKKGLAFQCVFAFLFIVKEVERRAPSPFSGGLEGQCLWCSENCIVCGCGGSAHQLCRALEGALSVWKPTSFGAEKFIPYFFFFFVFCLLLLLLLLLLFLGPLPWHMEVPRLGAELEP